MSFESNHSHIDEVSNIKDSVEYQNSLNDRVKRVQESMKYSLRLIKANDVLNILELDDKQEDMFRQTLLRQSDKTLDVLVTQPKAEIQKYILNFQKSENSKKENLATHTEQKETKKQNEANERIETKLSKIK
jgi:DnaJ-domain-containing protein 1